MTDVPDTPQEDVDAAAAQAEVDELFEQAASGDPEPTPPTPPMAAPTTPNFDELNLAVENTNPAALSLLFDLALPVAIELGRTHLSVEGILALGRGSVIQLDRLAGEPIDVFVGDRRFAEGEVVVVGEQFGVRITQILAPQAIPGGEVA